MKKIILQALIVSMLFVLMGCSDPTNTLLISKYYETTDISNNSVELYNYGDSEVNLKNYSLEIYQNGSVSPTYTIKLSGKILANDYFFITQNNASSTDVKNKSDFESEELLFNGDDAVALSYKGQVVDLLGSIGSVMDFGKDTTLIRKDSAMIASPNFDSYNFISYQPNLFQFIKNTDYPISNNELMINGPRLTDEYRALPFEDPNNPTLGGGGAIEVTLSSVADGDTASFYNLDKTKLYKVRFFFIDTKEVAGTGSATGQPWGYPASAFTKQILNDAKENNKKIEIQSIKGNSLYDGYDRYLALVWVDGELVNFMVVRAGLSDVNAANINSNLISMAYQGIPYHSFLQNAWERANKNQWGLHTPDDPNWDYNNSKPILPISTIPDPRLYDPQIDE